MSTIHFCSKVYVASRLKVHIDFKAKIMFKDFLGFVDNPYGVMERKVMQNVLLSSSTVTKERRRSMT